MANYISTQCTTWCMHYSAILHHEADAAVPYVDSTPVDGSSSPPASRRHFVTVRRERGDAIHQYGIRFCYRGKQLCLIKTAGTNRTCTPPHTLRYQSLFFWTSGPCLSTASACSNTSVRPWIPHTQAQGPGHQGCGWWWQWQCMICNYGAHCGIKWRVGENCSCHGD